MNSEKISLKSVLEGILSFQQDLAKLYEQAAKEGSDRAHYQSFRQLESLNAQQATELKEILESQPETLDVEIPSHAGVFPPAARQQAGDEEGSLVAKAFLAEKTLLETCKTLLETAHLPPSIQNILERQSQASQQAQSLLHDFL
jgi:hypothetical protein